MGKGYAVVKAAYNASKYYDGKSSTSHNLRLVISEFELTGKDIETGRSLVRWRTNKIKIIEKPEKAKAGIITFEDSPDARLYISYEDFQKLNPFLQTGLFAGGIPTSFKSMMAIFVLSVGAIVLSAWTVPKLAGPVAKSVPYSWQVSLGEHVVGTLTNNKKECKSEEGLKALEKIISRLNVDGRLKKRPLKIAIIEESHINAFAAPGGHMVIFSELIKKADSAEEVAGVMAHELGHIVEKHPMKAAVRNIGMSLLISMMFGLSDGGGGAIAEILSMLRELSYSREAERDADRIAIEILHDSSIDPEGLRRFFERISKIEKEGTEEVGIDNLEEATEVLNYLSSHPSTPERIRDIRINKDKKFIALLTDNEWQALKSICK